jgi:hypothetical protein
MVLHLSRKNLGDLAGGKSVESGVTPKVADIGGAIPAAKILIGTMCLYRRNPSPE